MNDFVEKTPEAPKTADNIEKAFNIPENIVDQVTRQMGRVKALLVTGFSKK